MTGAPVYRRDQDYSLAIHAVIGRAVSELIAAGEPIGRHNILITLQVHSAQTTQKSQKLIYRMAFRTLLEECH